MAIKKISGESNTPKPEKKFASDVQMKPLIRQYCKDNPESVGEPHPVIGGRLTTNGWFLLETKEFVLLIPGGGNTAKNLFETIFPGIHNQEKNQLVVVPDKTDKFFGYLAIDDSKKTKYFWDSEDYKLYVGALPGKGEKQKPLSLEDFG